MHTTSTPSSWGEVEEAESRLAELEAEEEEAALEDQRRRAAATLDGSPVRGLLAMLEGLHAAWVHNNFAVAWAGVDRQMAAVREQLQCQPAPSGSKREQRADSCPVGDLDQAEGEEEPEAAEALGRLCGQRG